MGGKKHSLFTVLYKWLYYFLRIKRNNKRNNSFLNDDCILKKKKPKKKKTLQSKITMIYPKWRNLQCSKKNFKKKNFTVKK